MLAVANESRDEAEAFLSYMRTWNSQLFRALDERNMVELQRARIVAPNDDLLEHAVWMDVWDYSISRDAAWAMHDLALRSPQGLLVNVWNMACELHSEPAVMSLLPRIKREVANSSMLLPLVTCGQPVCNQCKDLQTMILQRFEHVPIDSSSERCFLDDDFDAVRNSIRQHKQANLFVLHHPILATSAKTAVVYEALRSRARSRWTMVAVIAIAHSMWRAWLRRQLAPGSRYLQIVQARWQMRALSLQ